MGKYFVAIVFNCFMHEPTSLHCMLNRPIGDCEVGLCLKESFSLAWTSFFEFQNNLKDEIAYIVKEYLC